MSVNYPRTELNKANNKIEYKLLHYKWHNPPFEDWYPRWFGQAHRNWKYYRNKQFKKIRS